MKKCYTIITISLPTIKIFWEKKKKGLPFVRRKIAEYRKKERQEGDRMFHWYMIVKKGR